MGWMSFAFSSYHVQQALCPLSIGDDNPGMARRKSRRRRDQLAGEIVKGTMKHDDAYEAAMREHFASVTPVKFEKPGGRFPTRDELYDRPKRWS
jgi:hypothetical protein